MPRPAVAPGFFIPMEIVMTEAFFATSRPLSGGSLQLAQLDGLSAILAATKTFPRLNPRHGLSRNGA